MNTFKNVLIALLAGLLALSLFTQPAQSATKTYDAVKLVQFASCLDYFNSMAVGKELSPKDYLGSLSYPEVLASCTQYKP